MSMMEHEFKKIRKTYCWFCGEEMIWGGDDSFEDYGLEGEGIVANLSCLKCGSTSEFYTKIEG